ncbi:Panacea domain-containing protein [Blastococcus saxobsidens]|nr:type II toxin-antitoxin system antitoxin SocA domain-containing protein [Blastococcus saxobsidens]
MPVSARTVAAELRRRVPGLGSKKQHKLLYYCQGHHLAAVGKPLFRESVSAWDMGPVVGQLWYEEKTGVPSLPTMSEELTEAQLNTIGYVVSRYGALSGTDLEHLTHSESPWLDADRDRRPHESVRIPEQALRSYFEASDDCEDDDATPPPDSQSVRNWLAGVDPENATRPKPQDTVEGLRRYLPRRG